MRIMADSLAMTARSSAAVLQARTWRIRSRSLRDIVAAVAVLLVVGGAIRGGAALASRADRCGRTALDFFIVDPMAPLLVSFGPSCAPKRSFKVFQSQG